MSWFAVFTLQIRLLLLVLYCVQRQLFPIVFAEILFALQPIETNATTGFQHGTDLILDDRVADVVGNYDRQCVSVVNTAGPLFSVDLVLRWISMLSLEN